MKKHTYIFVALLLVGAIGMGIFWKTSEKAFSTPTIKWEYSGDKDLLTDVDILFTIGGGATNDLWEVSYSPLEDSLTYDYSTMDYEVTKTHFKENAAKTHRGEVYAKITATSDSYLGFWANWSGEKKELLPLEDYATESDYICREFYEPYIEEAIQNETTDMTFDPIPLYQKMENFEVELELNGKTSKIAIPVPQEIMMTPQVYLEIEDDYESDWSSDELIARDGSWHGDLVNFPYIFQITKAYVSENEDVEYLICSLINYEDANDPNTFTNIYRLTINEGKELLDTPELVKAYDCFQPIYYIGDANGKTYSISEYDEGIKISLLDPETLEPIHEYYKANRADKENFKEYGIYEAITFDSYSQSYYYPGDMIRFVGDKLYVVSLVRQQYSDGGILSDYTNQWLELNVYEPTDEGFSAMPVATGILNCSLFKLAHDGFLLYDVKLEKETN